MNFFYNADAERTASVHSCHRLPPAIHQLRSKTTKTLLRAVKLTAILMLTTCLQVSAQTTNAQKLSLSLKNGSRYMIRPFL